MVTRTLLRRHLAALVVLSLLSGTALLVSYDVVHRSPERVRTSTALAAQQVAAARIALETAHRNAEAAVGKPSSRVTGVGEGFRTQISAADQNLSRAADKQLAGSYGRGELDTVDGLLTVYADAVNQAAGMYGEKPEDMAPGARDELSTMRELRMTEAGSLMHRRVTGMLPRLAKLQERQLEQVRRELEFSTAQRVGWALAEAFLILTGLVLLSATAVLRRRCGRLFNGWLLCGLVLTLVLAVVPVRWTSTTQDRLDTVSTRLTSLEHAATQRNITRTAAEVRHAADTAHGRAGPLLGFGACGVALLVLPATGLLRRLRTDYGKARP
ncbi:hypothetical protein [Streptomyces sp. NPDC048172]|uniref:hypothetical protein n=1 Tax=Streptomyces sp. NPDC048172 TaxID=3365505 RepID=UPI0037130214